MMEVEGGGGMEINISDHDHQIKMMVEEELGDQMMMMANSLKQRSARNKQENNNNAATTTTTTNGDGDNSASQQLLPDWTEDEEEEEEEEKQEKKKPNSSVVVDEVLSLNNNKNGVEEEEEAQLPLSENSRSIYFDKIDGTWKCRHCTWTYRMGSSGIDHIQNSNGHCHEPMNTKILTQQKPFLGLGIEGTESNNGTDGIKFLAADCSTAEKAPSKDELDFKVENPDTEKSPANGLSHHENLKDGQQSGLHFLLSENPLENGNASLKAVGKHVHLGAVKESKQEAVEWDVEKVLEEQETHDLYCPKCKSCITKRVILRKRKRKVPNDGSGNKRDKTETPPQSSLDTDPSVVATYGLGDTSFEPSPDVSPDALGTNDNREHDTGPETFRCLSCFSFFTVAGSKLLRIFGVRDGGESIQGSQQTPARSIRATEQGDDARHVEEGDVQALNQNQSLSNQRGDHVSPMLGVSLTNRSPVKSVEPVSGTDVGFVKGEKDFVAATNLGALEEAKIGDEQPPDGTKIKSADEKNGSISSLATTFPFLEQSQVNEQVKVSIGKHKVDEQNILVLSIQEINTEDKHESVGKKIDGVSGLPGYSYTLEEENVLKQKSWKEDKDILTPSEKEALLLQDRQNEIGKLEGVPSKSSPGHDVIVLIQEETVRAGASQSVQNNIVSAAPVIPPVSATEPYADEQGVVTARRSGEWDILKSIVYGGLIEVITSLGVVSSAAGGDASTLNIMALGLANLVSGLIIIVHTLWELRIEQHGRINDAEEVKVARYEEVLGHRYNFRRHTIVAVLSYLVFGLLPPIVYGFSFRKTDNREYKIIAVAAASLVCIILLAIGKAHTQKPPNKSYIKTTLYYVSIGVMASGLSYVAGELIIKLLEKLALFEPNAAAASFSPSSSAFLLQTNSPAKPAAWASY